MRPRHERRALRAAAAYLSATRGAGDVDVQRQGDEAPRFKALFHGWADACASPERHRPSVLVGRVVDSSDSSASESEAEEAPRRRHSCGF